MRKRILASRVYIAAIEQKWLDLEGIASVEVTSEDKAFPIESAALRHVEAGWRAGERGVQRIRLIFEEPQRLRYISLLLEETETKRAQEFTLRCSPGQVDSFQEIVR